MGNPVYKFHDMGHRTIEFLQNSITCYYMGQCHFQWWIQDFQQGAWNRFWGYGPLTWFENVSKTKELGPAGGACPGTPPRSTNDFILLDFLFEVISI